MLSFIDPDPLAAVLKIVLCAVLAGVAILLWRRLQLQARQHGGGNLAAATLALAIVGLLVSVSNLLPFDIGILMLIGSVLAIYRPATLVRVTGGPSLRYRALREGRELQLLVREHGGWSVARRNEAVKERVDGLKAFEGPGTERYIELVRATVLANPSVPSTAAKLAELAAADAELHATIPGRPFFESELKAREAALDGPGAGAG